MNALADVAPLTGFARFPNGRSRLFNTVAEAIAAVEAQATIWVDFPDPNVTELAELAQVLRFDPETIEDARSGEQRPRLDEFDDYLFLLLYGMVGPDPDDEVTRRKVVAWFGANYLVTAHAEPLRSINQLLTRCQKQPERMLARGSDYLLFVMIDSMVDRYIELVNVEDEKLDTLEDVVLGGDLPPYVLGEALASRRRLLELRRLAISQRELLSPLTNAELEYTETQLALHFRHVADHLKHVIEMVDGLRDRLDALRGHHESLLAAQSNEVMKTLTIFASIMLPLGLIAGVYGMNVPLWPPQESPVSFVLILAVMATVAGGLLLYFRRKKWL